MISAISIRHGVPPRICPTFRSCIMSPAIPAVQQTTVATANTAIMPLSPVVPSSTIIRAAISRVVSVRPEMGFEEDPIKPTRYPATAAKKKPATAITSVATIPETALCEK
jgi:hypothetical protein